MNSRQKVEKGDTIAEKDVKPDGQPIVQTQQSGSVKRKFEFDLDSTVTPTVTKTSRPGLSTASTTKLNEGLKKTLTSTKSTSGLHDSVSSLNLSTTMSVDDQKPLLSDRSDREPISSRASMAAAKTAADRQKQMNTSYRSTTEKAPVQSTKREK